MPSVIPTATPSIPINELAAMVTDNIAAMVAYWNTDEICLFSNYAHRSSFGKSLDEMIGIQLKDLLGPRYELNLPYIRRVLKGEAQVFEREIPFPDGSTHHSLTTYTPDIADGVVRGFVVHVTDVTPMKTMEHLLLETTERFHSALMALQEGIVIKDRNGTIRLCNPAALKILDVTEAELLGSSSIDPYARMIHEDGTPWLPETRPMIVSLRRGIELQDIVIGIPAGDGTTKWIRTNASPIFRKGDPHPVGVVGTFIEITQRRALEREQQLSMEALRNAEMRLQEAQEIARIGSWEFDVRSGKITWSKEMFRVLQFDPDRGEPDYEQLLRRYHPDDVPIHQAMVNRCIKDGTPYEFDIRAVLDDGSIRWIRATGKGVANASGAFTNLFGTVQDITDQKSTEEELRNTRDMAMEATRAKSLFLANMSHELRTPMNGVMGMAELLLLTGLTPEQREYAETINSSGQALLTLLNDILDLSKIDAGKLELESIDFNLHLMVDSIVTLFSQIANRSKVRLIRHIASDIPASMRGDIVRIRQILSNLISNGIKFTEQGEVAVSLERDHSHPVENSRHIWIRISVTDSGIGIDRETQAHLFQNFSQGDSSTTRRYGGTGLGLAISRRLAEMMGGTMGLESEPGKGSTFWFTIPLETAIKPVEKRELTSEVIDISGFKILVAEDNRTNQIVIRRYLEKRGCSPHVVEDGSEVLDVLQEQEYDLVLMDCHMPNIDGYEATRRLRKRESAKEWDGEVVRRSIPVIALTASAMAEDHQLCIEAGMNDFMTKPIQSRELDQMLQRWLLTPTDSL